jgi:hypothetical protein
MHYLFIVLGIVGALAAAELLVEFHDWNRQQACATAGGRNCPPGGARLFLGR